MTETSATYTLTRPNDDISIRYNTVKKPVDGMKLLLGMKSVEFFRLVKSVKSLLVVITSRIAIINFPPKSRLWMQMAGCTLVTLGVFDEQGKFAHCRTYQRT